MDAYNGSYIFPPRTKMTTPFYNGQSKRDSGKAKGIAPITNLWMRMQNVWAQLKLKGNRNLIKVSPDRKIEFWNRHAELQQTYRIPDDMRAEILRISPEGTWTVWDSELMNFKTKEVKDMVYLYDVLVFGGNHLTGQSYQQRYDLLKQRVGEVYLPFEYKGIDRPLYLAKNYAPNEWSQVWDTIWAPGTTLDQSDTTHGWIEGLVAKRFNAAYGLEKGLQEYNNSGFMCRMRKPHKNYTS